MIRPARPTLAEVPLADLRFEYFQGSVVEIAPTALVDHVARLLGDSLLEHT